MAARLLFLAILLPSLPAAVPARAGGPATRTSGYTVGRTANGVQLTVHFDRQAYPAHALVEVTATLRNLSHRHLAVHRAYSPNGLCSWPVVSIVSVDAAGQPVEPVPPIPRPAPSCPAPPQQILPIGRSLVEHQLKVLWTPRLRIAAHLSNFVHDCYCGFEFQGPPAQFRLYRAPAPTISVRHQSGATVAFVSPPAGTRGSFYYQSWGSCPGNQMSSGTYYWKSRLDRTIPSVCSNPVQWHLDVAWLNMPVASLNLGARRVSATARKVTNPSVRW